MISEIKKKEVNVACPHCGEKSNEAWMMTYQSKSYFRIIYMCVNCREVIKISEEGHSEDKQLVHANQPGVIDEYFKYTSNKNNFVMYVSYL